MEFIENKKAKKIRKILLTFVDIEIRNKKKSNNYILINSMNPIELDNIMHINQESINISTTHYTNTVEKHLVKRVVDKNNNINYFYSDNLGKKNGMLILKKQPDTFLIKFFAKNQKMHIGMVSNNIENNNKKENQKDYIHLYSFNLIKKDIGEIKIMNNKYLNESKAKNIDKRNILIKKEEEYFKETQNLKNISLKYLINYCYTHINKKKPFNSLQKYNNNKINENNNEINNINQKIKKNKNIKSKEKNLKIIKNTNNAGKEEKNKNKSTRNNIFINKFKKYLENGKMKNIKKVESKKKIKRTILKINSNSNLLGINYEDLKYSKKNNKFYEMKSKRKSAIPNKNRNNILDYNSTLDYSSPENTNSNINKNKKSHKFIFHYKKDNNTINRY